MPPPQCRTVYRDYDARNDTKHHERRRLTNAGERGERKGDGDGGGRRSDTVVVVGSRYADTFAGCERPGQRRVNWRRVPSRDSHHDPAPPSREFSCATSSCYLFNGVVKEGGRLFGNCELNVVSTFDVRIKYWGEKVDYT
ncbi:uncharacterized protein LOC112639118 isoform X2 [Camponotus floridanus]|uniref:uncharacterized protein LOC112639118 isoform X2 n=1 Tax=Camponotus floridanus TaxID=104421 RepID=UPI00059D1DEA|nr:uncharacterized protein LOC112639118 isoform X2 [Camponotus floridanus]